MKHVILVELDALLDTRLGVLIKHNPDIADEMLKNGWNSRMSEEVEPYTDKLTTSEYRELYKKRDESVLPYSIITNLIYELVEVCTDMWTGIMNDNTRITGGGLVVNTYPYVNLSKEEHEAIVGALRYYLPDDMNIMVAQFRPDQLDLVALKQMDILTYICYDYREWFMANFNTKKGKDVIIPYPKLTIWTPAVLPDKRILSELTAGEIDMMKGKDVLDMLREYWSPLLGLRFTPIEAMCAFDPTVIPD